MAILLSLVEGKVTDIGKNEREALIGLRTEFIRRNVELNSLDKIIQKYEKQYKLDQSELDKYEDRTIL